ncbi:MAG: alanine dehydrogenase [Bacteroidetes bacterium]|nr:alanine dehydrogenase [Bacteroidota bacterium]
MIIGVPKEIKVMENRVGLTPMNAHALVQAGHTVYVETKAGEGSGFSDADYTSNGGKILQTPKEVYDIADMIVKVKEPIKPEYALIKKGQILFTYFHFAASKELTDAIIQSGAVALAYETVQKADKSLPLLTPMSEVAGRMAIQEGAKYLEKAMGGRGILLGGVPGVAPASVVILGGGVVGMNAAKIAAGMGADVTILDLNIDQMRYLDDIMPKNVNTLMSNSYNIRQAVLNADLVVGAVLLPGAKAPKLVTREMIREMKKGAVVVDVAVDQGGCIETCTPTTHENPTFIIDGVVHYCVANMPGAVPFTSTIALNNATLPYTLQIAKKGWKKACLDNNELKLGLNIVDGKVVYAGVADAFGYQYVPVESVLG